VPVSFPDSAPKLLTPKAQLKEIGRIIDRMSSAFLKFHGGAGGEALALRIALGDLQAFYIEYYYAHTLGTAVLRCFKAATSVGFTLNQMDYVLYDLLDETPTTGLPLLFVQSAVNYSIAQDARILAKIVFTSRDDIDVMMSRMQKVFNLTLDRAADAMDSFVYSKLLELFASVSRYLAETGRPLPRVVQYELSPHPSLSLANRIYADATRAEEIVAENKIINPVFCPRVIRVLSA
jgi:hypothetical protein